MGFQTSFLNYFSHWSALKSVGLNTSGLSLPKPHSLFVKVFVVNEQKHIVPFHARQAVFQMG